MRVTAYTHWSQQETIQRRNKVLEDRRGYASDRLDSLSIMDEILGWGNKEVKHLFLTSTKINMIELDCDISYTVFSIDAELSFINTVVYKLSILNTYSS